MIVGFNKETRKNIKTDVSNLETDRGFIAHLQVSAANAITADTDGILAAVVDTGAQQVITQGIVNPGAPRNVTATAGGTATDIKAIQIIVEGTNFNDEPITETLPAFTVDTAGIVQGNKAFKTITKITIPAHDGVGVMTSIGFGEKLGIPYKLAHNTVLATYLDNIKEATAPTITVDSVNLEGNTIDLSSALNGKVVDTYLIV
jgi:hypothetical protein